MWRSNRTDRALQIIQTKTAAIACSRFLLPGANQAAIFATLT
jgi:hypothetical protein